MSDKKPVTFAMQSTGALAAGTRILLDGVDISLFVSAVHLRCSANEMAARVYLELVPKAGIDIQLPADVTVAPAFQPVGDDWMDNTAVGDTVRKWAKPCE